MRTQKRWECRECHREWIHRTQGPDGNCPACGSPEIYRVEFSGLFDIHTPAAVMQGHVEAPPPVKRESEVVPPPMTLTTEDLWRP